MNRDHVDLQVWTQVLLVCRRLAPCRPHNYEDSEMEGLQTTLQLEFRRLVEAEVLEVLKR